MQVVCKNCPVGCVLTVSNGVVTGNRCPRGLSYRNMEEKSIFHTTVKLKNSNLGHLSIKSDISISESEKEKVSTLLKDYVLEPPINSGALVIYNIGNLGISFLAQRKITN